MLAYKKLQEISNDETSKFLLFMKEPLKVQNKTLQYIINKNKNSKFGIDHNFSNISSIEEYQSSVNINEYEDLSAYIEESKSKPSILSKDPIEYFAITSGTSGKSKFIPHTKESLKNWNLGLMRNLFSYVYNKKEDTNILKGKFAHYLGSSHIKKINDIPVGYISGISQNTNTFLSDFTSIPREIMELTDYDEKLFETAKCIVKQNIVGFGGITTFSLSLINYIKNNASKFLNINEEYRKIIEPALDNDGTLNLRKLWPDLQIFLSCGVILNGFESKIKKIIGENVWIADFYAGTEGAYSFTFNPQDKGMFLNTDMYFFEFRNLKTNKVLLLNEVELNGQYEVIITAVNGLYRYTNEDIVQFTSINPYNVKVVGRKSTIMNLASEKINEVEICDIVNYSLRKFNLEAEIYFIFAWVDDELNGHYCLAIELNNYSEEKKSDFYEFINKFEEKMTDIIIQSGGGVESIVKFPHYIILKNGTNITVQKEKSKETGNAGHSKIKKILTLEEAEVIIKSEYILEENLPDEVVKKFKEKELVIK